MTDNALDPPPPRRPKPSGRRMAAILVGVVIALGVAFVIGRMVFQHPAAGPGGFDRAAFARSGPAPTPPPAVPPAVAERTVANIRAAERAAKAAPLTGRTVQMAAVSPPAGPAPSGVGVRRSHAVIGPAAG